MLYRNALRFVALATVATVLFGCSGGSSSTTASGTTDGKPGAAEAGKTIHLAFVTNNASDFWKIAKAGTEKAKSELGNVDVEFVIPDDGTAGTQKQRVDDLLSKGVDGVAISPVAPKDQVSMLNHIAEKAIVVTQDSDAPDSNRSVYIGTDNIAAGKMAGEELKKALPEGGKVAVFVGNKDAQNARERIQGLTEAIQGTKIVLLDTITDGTDHAKAKSNAADTLIKNADLAGMVGIWSYNAPGILGAVKDAHKTGKVKIVAFDEEDDTLKGVKDGFISATIVQNPYEFGYKSIKILYDLKNGKKDVVPADKKIIVPTRAISKDTVDAFKKELDQRLGRG